MSLFLDREKKGVRFFTKVLSIALVFAILTISTPVTIFANDSSNETDVSKMIQPLAEVTDKMHRPIPDDLLKTINEKNTYSKLSESEKLELCEYLSVSKNDLQRFGKEVKDLSEISTLILNAQNCKIKNSTVLSLFNKYTFDECINIEKKLDYLAKNIIDARYIDNFANILSDNKVELNDIYGAVILSRITHSDYSWAFKETDIDSIDFCGQNSISGANYIYLQLQYNLSSQAIDKVLSEENMTIEELCNEINSIQQELGIYSLNSDLSTYDVSTQQLPQGFSKYQIPDASNYRDDISVDQTYGMVTYNKELITLQGKNDLDLQFGVRFDQNDTTMPGQYEDIESIPSAYQVVYTTNWYMLTPDGQTLMMRDHIKKSPIYYDASQHSYYVNQSTIVEEKSDDVCNVYEITEAEIHANDAGSLTQGNYKTTHNNKIFQLGDGWAFTIPSIEVLTDSYENGICNIIHFADGQKYSFKYTNNEYRLIGYDFKDIQLFDAYSNEFISDGKNAKWVLQYKNGRCEYFSADGRYLGSTDRRGALATASIVAYYDTNGYLVKLTDSVGRSIRINHCVEVYEDDWIGTYEEYYTDIVLCDVGENTGELLYRFNKFVGGIGSGTPTLCIINVMDDEAVIKSTRFEFSLVSSDIFFNYGGGYIYDTDNKVIPYPNIHIQNYMTPVMTSVYDYYQSSDGMSSIKSAQLNMNYEEGHRFISDSTYVNYGRLKSIERSEMKYDSNYNPIVTTRDKEEYNYYKENKSSKIRTNLDYNGSWNDTSEKIWPLNAVYDYVLEVKENCVEGNYQKSTEYHYGDDKYNDLVRVYDISNNSKQLYSTSDIQRLDNNHSIIESVRLINSEDDNCFCTLQKKDLDDYANTIYEWSAGGSADLTEYVQAYYTISSQSTNYDNPNKSIPTSVFQRTFASSQNIHEIYIKTENILDESNSHIIRQNNYINETWVDWNTYQEIETNTPIDSIDLIYDSQGRLVESDQLIVSGDSTEHKVTEYTYDTKYGIYIDSVNDVNQYINSNGELINSQKNYTYDVLGRILSCEDNNDKVTTYQYDTLGTLIKAINPDGTEIITIPDYVNKNVVEIHADGSKAKYVYDLWDQLIEEYIWNSTNNEFVLTTKYEYDENNRNTKKYEYVNDTATQYLCTYYTYDFLGRTIRETLKDETGTVLNDYSTQREIISFNNEPLERETTTYYNSDGTVHSHVKEYNDVGGNTVRIEQEYDTNKYYINNYSYDDFNRITSSSGDTTETKNYIYDDIGRLIQVKDDNNKSTYYTYDSQNRLVSQSNDSGAVTNYYYTPHGINYRIDTLVDTVNGTDYYNKTIAGYDVYGNIAQLKQSINNPGEADTFSVTNYTYDINNRVIMTEDIIDSSHARYSQYCYDNAGNLIKAFTGLTRPLTIINENNYTANDDDSFSVVSYEYDDFGNNTKYTDALGRSELYEYSFSNKLNKKTLRDGTIINYAYDAMGRCIQESVGNKNINYSYDNRGQLISVQDELGITSFNYDLLNRLTMESRDDVDNGRDYVSQYEYSGAGITDYKLFTKDSNSEELQTSVHETYEYNNLKQIARFTHSDIASPQEIISVLYTYGDSGEIVNKQITGASITQNIDYTYNKAGYTTGISNSNTLSMGVVAEYPDEILITENYNYSLGGNLTEKISTESISENSNIISQNNELTSYSYDSLNRLVQEQYAKLENSVYVNERSISYNYDESDNRLSKITQIGQSEVTSNYQYDSANKLVFETNTNGNEIDYLYDNNGNLISKSLTNDVSNSEQVESYIYDSFNRLSTVQKDNKTFSYVYDGINRRIEKNSNEKQLKEFWNNGRIVFESETTEENDILVNTNHSYVFDNSLIAVTSEGLLTNLAITNIHGDTIKLLSAQTPIDTKYQYDAFGIQHSNDIPEIYNPYQYNGKYCDEETEFYYLNARYYNPKIGRFMQEDTYHGNIQSISTLNLYNYCGSNPIAYEDPTGHFWETVLDVASLAWSAYDFIKKPNLVNGLFLAWDIASVVVPFVPGSYVAKAVKGISKSAKSISKTLKSTKTVSKVVKTVDKVYDTSKAIKKAKQAQKTVVTAAESAAKRREIQKIATKNNVDKLVKSIEAQSSSKAKRFTQEVAEQFSENTIKTSYSRPSGYRKGVREAVWEQAKKEGGGVVRDPLTGKEMKFDDPWDMGHKPGYEFRKHQKSARERGISRKQFLNEYNNPNHYRPELPSSNRSHKLEDGSNLYLGP